MTNWRGPKVALGSARASARAEDHDSRLSRALEAVPYVEVPAGFAERVMRRVPERGWDNPTWAHGVELAPPARVGRGVAFGALLVLAVAMLGLLPLARGSGHAPLLVLEWMFCLEFVGITLWMTMAPHQQR
jgi:hypothetical protein